MKKAMALLLAVVMVFALCGCGGTSQGKSESTLRNEGEIQHNSSITVVPKKITVTQPNFQVQTIDLSDDTDYLEISNPKLTKVNGSIYRLSYDVKCTLPQDLGVDYPNLIIVNYQYLDNNGVSVRSVSSNAYSFNYGQTFTMDPLVHTDAYLMHDYLLDISEIESIVFSTYVMKNSTASPSWLGDWQFVTPIVYDIADLLPQDEITSAKEWSEKHIDPIQAEIVKAENGEEYLRVVNSGDKNQEMIYIEYQMLDKDGDVMGTSSIYVSDLDAGQGTKEKLTKKDVSAIKITKYVYPHKDGSRWITSVDEVFSMKNPITLKLG